MDIFKKKYVAKGNFDDGTNREEEGKPSFDYQKGQPYKGTGDQLKAALKSGLILTEAEFKSSQEVVQEQNATIDELKLSIQKLTKELAESNKKIEELTEANAGLREEIDSFEVVEDDESEGDDEETAKAKELAAVNAKKAADEKKAATAAKKAAKAKEQE